MNFLPIKWRCSIKNVYFCMQHIGFLSLKKFQLEFSGLKKTIVLSKMNMNKRKVYVVPEVRIVEVC